MSDKRRQQSEAVDAMWQVLRAMPTPRDAARALAALHVKLVAHAGADSEADVRAMLKESDAAVLDAWASRTGVPLAS